MTGRQIIGLPPACDVFLVAKRLTELGGDIDSERPIVQAMEGYSWYFLDPVRVNRAHLVRLALGCDSPVDGCLQGGRWKSREVSPDEIRSFAQWWSRAIESIVAECSSIYIVRHWYVGAFATERVRAQMGDEAKLGGELIKKLKSLPVDTLLRVAWR